MNKYNIGEKVRIHLSSTWENTDWQNKVSEIVSIKYYPGNDVYPSGYSYHLGGISYVDFFEHELLPATQTQKKVHHPLTNIFK